MEEKREIIVREKDLNIEDLFKKAIEKDASIDTLERLMKIREEIKREKMKEEFYLALSQLQQELPHIPTDCEVKNKDGSIRYRYASLKKILETIQPLLTKYGFAISYETSKNSKDEIIVTCVLRHTSGHCEKSSFPIPIDTSSYMSDVQRMGSTLTYAKRYSLMSVLNIVPEDDTDGIESEVIVQERRREEKPTLDEMRAYYIYLNKIGINKERAKELLKLLYETDTIKELNRVKYEELMEVVKQMKTKEDFESYLNSLSLKGGNENE